MLISLLLSFPFSILFFSSFFFPLDVFNLFKVRRKKIYNETHQQQAICAVRNIMTYESHVVKHENWAMSLSPSVFVKLIFKLENKFLKEKISQFENQLKHIKQFEL